MPGAPDIDWLRHVADQRRRLESLAERAVHGLKHRLFWHGFRPVESHWGADESRWSRDGGPVVYVATERARRYHGALKPAVSIVIERGRAHKGLELDKLAEQAVAAVSADNLPLAA